MAQKRAAGLNVRVLEDREVLFNFGPDPIIDKATGTFSQGWHSAGLEPADSQHGETREVTSNKTNLTGGQTATSYTAGGVAGTVDLIPGSPTLDYIEWPETVNQDGVLYRKHTSKVAKANTAHIHKFQSGIVRIKASREKAGLTVSERATATDPTPRALAINYENGGDEIMFEEMYYHVGEDGTVTLVEPKIFKTIDDLKSQVDAGTAFIPDASESGLTAYVPVADEVDNAEDGVTLQEFPEAEEEKAGE